MNIKDYKKYMELKYHKFRNKDEDDLFKKLWKARYEKGDICWNCGKKMKNPKLHYPITSGIFCKE